MYSYVLLEVLRVGEVLGAEAAVVPAHTLVRLREVSLQAVGRAELLAAHVTHARTLSRVDAFVEQVRVR